MAITTETRTEIIQLVVGMFDAAPGASYLSDFVNNINGGGTIATLAAQLSQTTVFKGLYPDLLTNNEFATNFVNNLVGSEASGASKAWAVNWLEGLLNGGATRAEAMVQAITALKAVDEADANWGNAAKAFNNQVEVAEWYSVDQLASSTSLATLQNVISPVTSDDATVTAITSGSAVSGETFTLTTGQDNIQGTTGNDTIIGLVDNSTDTLTLGDTINGAGGTDSLQIAFEDNADLNLSGKTITNVENLVVDYANSTGGADLNIANKAFDSITVDFDATASDVDVNLDSVAATSAVTVQNIAGDANHNVDVNFTSSSATSASTTVAYADLDVNEFYSDINAAFSAATAYEFNLSVADVDSNDNFNVNANIDLDAADVALTANVDIDNVMGEDVNFYLDFNTNGVTAAATVNITDSNVNEFYLDIDDNNNGTSNEDVLTLNLSSVNTDGDENENMLFNADDFETVNINVDGNGAVISDLEFEDNDGNDFTLNIVANADLTVEGDVNINSNVGSATINVSGAGNVNLGDLDMYVDANDNTVMTVDAAALTGNLTLVDSNGNGNVAGIDVLTGGSGDDTITLGGYTTVVDTGAGDDFVDLNGVDYGDADAETVEGGEGADTIAINDGALLDAATAANISGFEVLDIRGGTGDYDMSVESSLTSASLTNTALTGDVNILNAAAGAELAFAVSGAADVNLTGGNALSFALEDDTGTSDSLDISISADDTDTDQTAEAEVTAALTANGIESISIDSSATTASRESSAGADDALTSADYTNVFTLYADDATDIILTGDAMLDLTIGADDANANSIANTAVDFIDASGNTAGVTVDMSAIDTDANAAGDDVAVNTAAVTFRGSDAADTYTASHNGDIIQGNGGADTINLSDNGTLTAATDADETVRYVAASDSQLTLTDTNDDGDADTATGFDVINDFGTAGTDILELSSALGLAAGDARSDIIQKGSFTAGVANLEDFIGDGVGFFDTGLVDRAVAFAHDGTDGYVFIDVNSDGDFAQVDDMFIELAGVTSLAITDISFG